MNDLPSIELRGGIQSLLKTPARNQLEQEILPEYLTRVRWFGGKAKTVDSVKITDFAEIDLGTLLLFTDILYSDSDKESYFVPIKVAPSSEASFLDSKAPQAKIAVTEEQEQRILYDPTADRDFCRILLAALRSRMTIPCEEGLIEADPLLEIPGGFQEIQLVQAEQSNTSVKFDQAILLKLFRQLRSGVNPDLEIGTVLTENNFAHAPRVLGSFEYRRPDGDGITLSVAYEFVPNQGDALDYTLRLLTPYYERCLGKNLKTETPPARPRRLLESKELDPAGVIGDYLEDARKLGKRTAELHLLLGKDDLPPAFQPERFDSTSVQQLSDSMWSLAEGSLNLLEAKEEDLSDKARPLAKEVLLKRDQLQGIFQKLRVSEIHASRTRCHGDYHLGQVLVTDDDFVIIDFEGEPIRTMEERRTKKSPLTDVAGMLRSFHYVTQIALYRLDESVENSNLLDELSPWARYWNFWVSAAFFQSYVQTAGENRFLPDSEEQLELLVSALLAEKAAYELKYELNNRPHWVAVPLRGILTVCAEN